MSCWVVPSVAAEVWGTTIEHILAGMRDGSIPTKQEKGFTFVDVAPESEICPTLRRSKEDRPPTYVPLTREETSALLAPLEGYLEFPDSRDEDEALDHLLDDIESSDADESSNDSDITVLKWNENRKRVAKRRVGPARFDLN